MSSNKSMTSNKPMSSNKAVSSNKTGSSNKAMSSNQALTSHKSMTSEMASSSNKAMSSHKTRTSHKATSQTNSSPDSVSDGVRRCWLSYGGSKASTSRSNAHSSHQTVSATPEELRCRSCGGGGHQGRDTEESLRDGWSEEWTSGGGQSPSC